MKLAEILEAIGVPWVISSVYPLGLPVGRPPGLYVELRRVDGIPTVVVSDMQRQNFSDVTDEILHEALHAMVGKPSFSEEGALMVFQWAMICELESEERKSARRDFGDYGMDSFGVVGTDDSFLSTREWRRVEESAVDAGIMVWRGGRVVPVWGLGVHPSLKRKASR